MAETIYTKESELDYREIRLAGAKAEVYSSGFDVKKVTLISGSWINNGNGGDFTADPTFDKVVYDVESDYNLNLLVQVLEEIKRAEITQETNKAFSLFYKALTGGQIIGEALQVVTYGSNGASVAAAPDSDYEFVKWSDGVTDNPRLDKIITNHINVVAEFVKKQFNLIYMVDSPIKGYLIGNAIQTVEINSDGTAVTAAPLTGYRFYDWNDGSYDNPRIHTDVVQDVSVTANFQEGDWVVDFNSLDENEGLVGISGVIEVPKMRQIINDGSDAVAIEALPAVGYSFTEWSDGNTENPRTLTSVSGDISLNAVFTAN